MTHKEANSERSEPKIYFITYSLGHDTNTSQLLKVTAKSEIKAIQVGRLYFEERLGREKLKQVYEKKGLPGSYFPYYFIHR